MEILIDLVFALFTIALNTSKMNPQDSFAQSGTSIFTLKEVIARREYGISDPYDYEANFIKPIIARLFLHVPLLIEVSIYLMILMIILGRRLLYAAIKQSSGDRALYGIILFYANPYLYDMILNGRVYSLDFLLTGLFIWTLAKNKTIVLQTLLLAALIYLNYCNVLLLIIYQVNTSFILKSRLAFISGSIALFFGASYMLEGSWVG